MISGDHIALSGRAASDRSILSRDDQPVPVIGQRGCARPIDTDEVAVDFVVIGVGVKTTVFTTGDQVALAGCRASNESPIGSVMEDYAIAVMHRRGSVGGRTNDVALNHRIWVTGDNPCPIPRDHVPNHTVARTHDANAHTIPPCARPDGIVLDQITASTYNERSTDQVLIIIGLSFWPNPKGDKTQTADHVPV